MKICQRLWNLIFCLKKNGKNLGREYGKKLLDHTKSKKSAIEAFTCL